MPDLPVLQMIQENMFAVKDYALQLGHAKAIQVVLKQCKNALPPFNAVQFDNNNFSDEAFASILDGLAHVQNLAKIEYRNNELGQASLESLQPILHRAAPFNLRELVLSNCKLDTKCVTGLLELLMAKSSLTCLVLRGAHLLNPCMQYLVAYLQKNSQL